MYDLVPSVQNLHALCKYLLSVPCALHPCWLGERMDVLWVAEWVSPHLHPTEEAEKEYLAQKTAQYSHRKQSCPRGAGETLLKDLQSGANNRI